MSEVGPINPQQAAGFLNSGEAVDGYVLTSDGAGNAEWRAASGGGGFPVDLGLITDAPTSSYDMGTIT
jgi:hypothetical protein